MVLGIPLLYFNAFSLVVSLAATVFAFRKPQSMLFTLVFAVAVFILLGIFSIPGMLFGFGLVVYLKREKQSTPSKTSKRKV